MKRGVVILGATGGIGSGVVGAALAAGYRVIAIGRKEESLRALAARHEGEAGLITLRGSFATDEEAAATAEEIREQRVPLHGVVAAMGAPLASGRLLERSAQSFTESFQDYVVPHFLAMKYLLPLLAQTSRGTSYLAIGGAAADVGWAGYGHISIASAARKMLVHVLREECKDLPVRIQLLQIDGHVRTHKNARTACPGWVSADVVSQQVVDLLRDSDGLQSVVHLRGTAGHSSMTGEKR